MREQDGWQGGRMQSLAAEQEYPVRPWAEDGCHAFIRSLRRCCGIHTSCAIATVKGLHCLRWSLAFSGFLIMYYYYVLSCMLHFQHTF